MSNDIYDKGYNNLKKLGWIIRFYIFHIILIIIFIILLFKITIKWITLRVDEYSRREDYKFLFKVIVLFTCGLIGSFIHKLNKKKYEYFDTTVNTVVLQSSLWNFSQWTNKHTNWKVGSFNNDAWDTIVSNIKSNKINSVIQDTTSNILLLCDPLAKDIYFSNLVEVKNIVPPIPNGYFVSFMRLDKVNAIDCSYNFENKTIGYIDISDYYFIQAIIQSYRINPENVKLKQLNSADIQSLEFILKTTYIDIIITYIIPNSLVIDYITSQQIGVVGFSTLDFTRVKLFYPYIEPENVNLKNIFVKSSTSKIQVLDKNSNTILPTMSMKLLNIQTGKNISPSSIKETFITRLDMNPTAFDPNYRCYGNMIVENKAECDSIYDIKGAPKDYPTQWDKPCTSNEECPFYKKNTKYPNTRGGCLENGYCEMPIGLLQASPHVYYDTGKFQPFCYGCTPGNDPDCCNKTKDYAFPNDTNDRMKNGLKTSISLM